MPFKVHLPWNNLGCLGLTVGPYYLDIYRRSWTSRFGLGLFVSTPTRRLWITTSGVRQESKV